MVNKMSKYKTEQEAFWAGEFGNDYIDRNKHQQLISGNIVLFSKILAKTSNVKSIIEFGSNIGNNIDALNMLTPSTELSAIEINSQAYKRLSAKEYVKAYHTSILDFTPDYQRELAFIKGVLIHISPSELQNVYESLYNTSSRYICMVEYYNPTPVEVPYRGHEGKLFKRDFAGEFMDKYSGKVQLVDYGFTYHRDNNFPLDDSTWFLMEKI